MFKNKILLFGMFFIGVVLCTENKEQEEGPTAFERVVTVFKSPVIPMMATVIFTELIAQQMGFEAKQGKNDWKVDFKLNLQMLNPVMYLARFTMHGKKNEDLGVIGSIIYKHKEEFTRLFVAPIVYGLTGFIPGQTDETKAFRAMAAAAVAIPSLVVGAKKLA